MRGVRVGIAVLGVWLAASPPVRAGVYISLETRLDDRSLHEIKKLRGTLQSLALPKRPGDETRQKYEQLLAALEAGDKAGTLTEVGRADLGGLLLRFGRPRDAAQVLTAGQSGHFLILCNLAVAYHTLAVQDLDVNRLEEAILTQRRALAAWPLVWGGWTDEQWYFYRRVERLQLRLLELRFREMRLADGKLPVWQSVDDLFPGFRMVGPGGAYEAGRVAPAVLDALPEDAPWLVRELMSAYPNDPRLYWLFGELLNTRGRVEHALEVFNDLINVNQASNVRDLLAHRRVLLERATLLQDLRKTGLFARTAPLGNDRAGLSPLARQDLLWALAPRPLFAVPGAGPAAVEAGRWATTAAVEELQQEERLGRPPTADAEGFDLPAAAPPAPAPPPPAVLPDWRVLAVGFAAGVVVTLVVGLQRGEWKRRRQAARQRRQPVDAVRRMTP